MSVRRKPLSRRTFLRGVGGVALSLPFLEAMLPAMATANTTPNKRFVVSFSGTSCGVDTVSNPGAYGTLSSTMPRSWKSLEAVRQHVSIISNTTIPTYQSSEPTPLNASAINQQHGTTPAPMLAGVSSKKAMPVMVRAKTADQFVVDAIGQGTLFPSLQMRVQAMPYNGARVDRDARGIMSARGTLDGADALRPLVSPMEIYEKLFQIAGGTGGSVTPTPGTNPLARRASILDLVAADTERLKTRVSGEDRIRLDKHYTQIRELELQLQKQADLMSGGGGGGGGGGGAMGCGATFASPGQDPALSANVFGGWSSETERGELMADMIALALACDLTRVVSWMLSFDQTWMLNQTTENYSVTDMHEAAHKQTNGGSTADQQVAKNVTADNANWHASLFARLVHNLSQYQEGSETVLDHTFLALLFAEGTTAHNRSIMRHLVAGNGGYIKLGQHIDGGKVHPGKILITGMQSVGLTTNTLNELSGTCTAIEV